MEPSYFLTVLLLSMLLTSLVPLFLYSPIPLFSIQYNEAKVESFTCVETSVNKCGRRYIQWLKAKEKRSPSHALTFSHGGQTRRAQNACGERSRTIEPLQPRKIKFQIFIISHSLTFSPSAN